MFLVPVFALAGVPSKTTYKAPESYDVSISHVEVENPVKAIVEAPRPISIADPLRLYAKLMADRYGVSFEEMNITIDGESDWQPEADNPDDSDGGSWGIVQINIGKDAHPEITKEQALNPYFSIEFMAKEFANGNAWKWTCWKARVEKSIPIEKCPW